MPEFLDLLPPTQALNTFLEALPDLNKGQSELIATQEALGRVLAHPIKAPHPLPPFPRSTVDGYALRAADTFGASPSLPAYLSVSGEVLMGTLAEIHLSKGQTALVHTGGMIPEGADAVVMVEDTQQIDESEIEILKAVAPGENVLKTGEDVQPNQVVIDAGVELRPQEIGGLMALGFTEIQVVKPPSVGILSTGDEVIPPDQEAKPGQVRDVNTYTLAALVSKAGGKPHPYGIIPDSFPDLLKASRKSHAEDDILIITAGSSVSTRDITADVIQALGEPGVLVHGVSIKPGKPTILAVCEGVPVIGLPGNPVSALVVAGLFAAPIIRRLLGKTTPPGDAFVPAKLSLNVSSETGREDYLPVKLIRKGGLLSAEPVFGRSNLIFTLVRADGLIRIPPEATGLAAGADVQVQLF
jgi:molybdopterin molybdotransferase